MADKPAMISIPRPLRARIRALQDRLRQQLGRAVTVSEAIEYWADHADETRPAGGS